MLAAAVVRGDVHRDEVEPVRAVRALRVHGHDRGLPRAADRPRGVDFPRPPRRQRQRERRRVFR
eukprot:31162-Pelagococcus_subviridis.AAC.13